MKTTGLLSISDLENYEATKKSIESWKKENGNDVLILNTQHTKEIEKIGKELNVPVYKPETKFGYPLHAIDELNILCDWIVEGLFKAITNLKSEYVVIGEPDCFFFKKTNLDDEDDSIDVFPLSSIENDKSLFWVFIGYYNSYGHSDEEKDTRIKKLFSDLDLICKKYKLDWKKASDSDLRFTITGGSIVKKSRIKDLYTNHKEDVRGLIIDICQAIHKNKPTPEINRAITSLFPVDVILSIVLGLYLFKWSIKKNYFNHSSYNFVDWKSVENFIETYKDTECIHSIKLNYVNHGKSNGFEYEFNKKLKKMDNDKEPFLDVWNECVDFNIEQKPEEYLKLFEFLKKNSKKRYALEIGSNYGGTTAGFCSLFEKVITIDIKHHANFDKLKSKFPSYQYIISDSKSNHTVEYIKSLGINFDFIFIDGDHSYEGVRNDYEKFKQFLAHDGYMAYHDIVYSQENVDNNCRVDKFWSEVREAYFEKYEFVSSFRNHSYRTDQLFYTFVNNRPYASWGGIGIIKNSPVGVFSHNYLQNHWVDIVTSQLSKLYKSGLYKRADKIVYGVQADTNDKYYSFLDLVETYDVDKKIEIYRYTKNMYEYPTLIHLQNYCTNNPNAAVVYFHAKGTSRPYDKNIESWRECLEYFNIEQWKRCHKEVSTNKHDVCGALYVTWFAFLDKVLTNYYSGNFWWASAKHINTLDNLSSKLIELDMNRDEPERWIGRKPHRWASLYNENVSAWYEHYFDPNIYKQSK